MNTKPNLNEVNKQKKTIVFIKKLDEFEEAHKGLNLVRAKKIEATCLARKIDFLNQETVIHNKLIEIIHLSIELLTQQEFCKFAGIKMSDYQKIDFNLKLPLVRCGKHLNNDLRAYGKMQARCNDLYLNKLSKNRKGSIFKTEIEI